MDFHKKYKLLSMQTLFFVGNNQKILCLAYISDIYPNSNSKQLSVIHYRFYYNLILRNRATKGKTTFSIKYRGLQLEQNRFY